jgi:hypothetical protein
LQAESGYGLTQLPIHTETGQVPLCCAGRLTPER